MNAVRKQNIASATAPKRVKIPSAIAIPAKSCRTIVATNTTGGTPIFDVAEAAPSKFNIKKAPSWMKMKARRSRPASSNALRDRPAEFKGSGSHWSSLLGDGEAGAVATRFSTFGQLDAACCAIAFCRSSRSSQPAGAEFCQRCQLLLGLVHVASLDIEFAQIFAGGLVVGLSSSALV